jgi:ABC-type cobalamin/Fe3+-siderophores transport system ATPase subunit
MKPIIDIRDITVSYRENVALKHISLEICEGELLAVAGPNGAGKTTLLTAINGLGRLLNGKVSVFGIQMGRGSATKIRKEIGYVPQMFNIDFRMPLLVKEAVMLGRFGKIGLFRRISLKDKRIVDEVVDLVGIGDLLDRPIGHLSGGEQKKVAIARALAQEPRILLLDEPISSLDINAQAGILELVERIHHQKGLTTIVVMHHLNLLPKNCSRMVLLKDARVIFNGPLEEALQEVTLSKLYGCPVEVSKNGYGVIVRAKKGMSRC